jgi:hypothetical protein
MRQQPPFWHYTQKRNCFEHLAWSPIQRKTPALDWGKCLSSGGLGDFYCWRFRQEAVYLVSNLRCKGSDYFNNNNNNKVNKVKTTVYLDFI